MSIVYTFICIQESAVIMILQTDIKILFIGIDGYIKSLTIKPDYNKWF